jgi:hypothetical protein
MASKPHKPIRWTLQQAGSEFDIDPATLGKRLRAESIEAGEDGHFGTKQILAAIAGDLDREKTRNEAAKADLHEMKRDLEKRRLIPAEHVRASLEELKVAISQVIDHSHLEPKQKTTIYANLQKLGERDFVAGDSELAE